MKHLHFRQRLFLILFGQLLILLAIGSAAFIGRVQSSELDEARLRLDSVASLVAGDLSLWMGEGLNTIAFAHHLDFLSPEYDRQLALADIVQLPEAQELIDQVIDAYPRIGAFSLMDPKTGVVLLSSMADRIGHNHSTDTFFIEGARDRYVSGLIQLDGLERYTVIISGPVTDHSDNLVAVAVVEMDLIKFDQMLGTSQGDITQGIDTIQSDTLSIFILSTVDDILVHLTPYEVVDPELFGAESLARIQSQPIGWETDAVINGTDALVAYRKVPSLDLAVAVSAGRSTSLWSALQDNYRQLLLMLALVLLGLGGVTMMVTGWLLQPLGRITASAQVLRAGDLDHRAQVLGQDEFSQLAQALNSMAESLQHSQHNLEAQVEDRTAKLTRQNEALQTEILDRQRAEATLLRQEASFQNLFEYAPVALWQEDFSQVKASIDALLASGVTDMAAYFAAHPEELDEIWALIEVLNVNQACLTMMGARSKSQIMPKLRPLHTMSQRQAFITQIQALVDGRTWLEFESVSTRFDGSGLFIRVRWSVAPGFEHNAVNVLVAVTDITALRQATEMIHLQSAALRASANAIVITDRDGVIQWVNPAFTQLTGYTQEEVIGGTPRLLKSGQHDDKFYEVMWRTIGSGRPWQGIIYNRRKDGGVYVEDQSIAPVHDTYGQITHYVAIKQDVTERVQTEESLIRQLKELSVVQEVAVLGTTITDVDVIIDRTTQLIGENFYPDHFGIMLLDEDGGYLTPHSSYRGVSEDALAWRVPLDQGVAGQVASTGKAIRVDNVQEMPGYLGATPTSRSELCVPLRANQRIMGIVNAESDQVGAFNADDERLLSTIAGQLAIAVERARLFTELHRRNLELTNLYGLALSAKSILASDDLLPYLADHLRRTLEPDSLFIALLDEENETMQIAVAWEKGTELDEFEGMTADLADAGLTGWVLENRHSLLIRDILSDEMPVSPRHMTGEVARSWLGVPMFVRDHMIGAISVQAFEPHRFTQSHQNFVEALASQAAIAIENAGLFDQIQELLSTTRGQAQQMERIIGTIPDGILLLSHTGRIVMANPVAESYLAVLVGENRPPLLSRLGNLPIRSLLTPSAPVERDTREITSPGAEEHTYEVSARQVSPDDPDSDWVVVLRDVTEERQRQEYQHAQERLATVGQLSAGIAHDFNNILGAIVLYSQMLRRQTELPEKYQNYLQTINDQAEHATNLIRQILDFSRKSVMQRRPLDLVPFLSDLARLLDRTLPDNIDVRLSITHESVLVSADATRLQQALMNLAVNARDAMPSGGNLSMTLTTFTLTSASMPPLPDMLPGHWVGLAVNDTGVGMAPDVLARIFEPFFSTKTRDKGTGLGLAQVYGIVKQHDGFIDVASRQDQGTTFSIYLSALAEADLPGTSSPVELSTTGAGETILIVEDNEAARMALTDVLDGLGYQVLAAEDGKSALEIYRTHAEDVDLVLSDMVMPQMGGMELFQALMDESPHVKLMIMTGYPLEDGGADLLRQGVVDWLPKPFNAEDLARRLSTVLAK